MNAKLLAVAILIPFAIGAMALAAGVSVAVALLTGIKDTEMATVVGLSIGVLIGLPVGPVAFRVADSVCSRKYGEYWML